MREIFKSLPVFKWKMLGVFLVLMVAVSGYCLLCDTEMTYEFDCKLDIGGEMIGSTKPIKLPDYLQREGCYEYINNTGCIMYVHERKAGLIKLPPGECLIDGYPVLFFVATPENYVSSEVMNGELLIKGADRSVFGSYQIIVYDADFLECTYHTKFRT